MPREHALVVLTEPAAGRDDEYNDWYSNTHLADVTSLPGFKSARRYELSADQLSGFGQDATHKYLAIYFIEGDAAEAFDALTSGIEDGSLPMSDSVDATKTQCWNYTAMDD
jgi:hypothetical protein